MKIKWNKESDLDYFGDKITIAKNEIGEAVALGNYPNQYLVEFQSMRFYAIEGIQIKIKDMKIKWNKETEPNFEDIKIGDKFAERDDEDEVFTVVDVFVPEFTIDVESITLKDSDGIQTTYPDDFDDGEFFDWFKPLK